MILLAVFALAATFGMPKLLENSTYRATPKKWDPESELTLTPKWTPKRAPSSKNSLVPGPSPAPVDLLSLPAVVQGLSLDSILPDGWLELRRVH
jgi:hypothetical protein